MVNEDKIISTAKNIVNNFLKVKKGENVLIVMDHMDKIISSFRKVLVEKEIEFKEVTITENRNNSAPIPEILKDLLWADVVIAPTKKSITHSPETVQAKDKGTRIVTLPGITEEIFLKINEANFKEIFELCGKLVKRLNKADKVEITTERGTEFSFSIKGRVWKGLEPEEGKGFVMNLPTGEVFCAPIENSANGKIAIDYWKNLIMFLL